MESKVAHIEIPAKDLKKAKIFYEKCFNWEVNTETGMPGYAFFKSGETGIGGAFDLSIKPTADGVKIYIQVENITSTLDKIKKMGGKILKEKTAIGGDFGFFALFEDISGNVLGLWSLK